MEVTVRRSVPKSAAVLVDDRVLLRATARWCPTMNEMTRMITAIGRREHGAAEQLLPLVYEELRRLAARKLAHEAPGQTLQPTALVHEAYLRLVGNEPDRPWDGRGHFFAAAAEAMRRILIEAARRKSQKKRAGGLLRIELGDPTAEDPVAAKVVELRQFAGLGHNDVAAALGITVYLARQKWTFARAWLLNTLGG
jgi:hypothetical protein